MTFNRELGRQDATPPMRTDADYWARIDELVADAPALPQSVIAMLRTAARGASCVAASG